MIAPIYNIDENDLLILDYRGFGLSNSRVSSEKQLFGDNQFVYDEMKKQYDESRITIIGYSIGTCLATKLASDNNPRQLILKAPYYSLEQLIQEYYSFIPSWFIRYKLNTYQYIRNVKCPITLIHGTKDPLIPFGHSEKLQRDLSHRSDVKLIAVDCAHNNINQNTEYQEVLKSIL